MTMVVESRTLEGALWLRATDVTAALRQRSVEYHDAAAVADERDHAMVYEGCAVELDLRADAFDLAAIEHLS